MKSEYERWRDELEDRPSGLDLTSSVFWWCVAALCVAGAFWYWGS